MRALHDHLRSFLHTTAVAVRALLVLLALASWSYPGMAPFESRAEAAEGESPAEEAESDSLCTPRRQELRRQEVRHHERKARAARGQHSSPAEPRPLALDSAGHRLSNGLLAPLRC